MLRQPQLPVRTDLVGAHQPVRGCKDQHHRMFGDRAGIDVADNGKRDLASVECIDIHGIIANTVARDDLEVRRQMQSLQPTSAGCE